MAVVLGNDPYALLGLPQEQPMGERERALFADSLHRRRRAEEFGYDMAAQQVGYGMQGQMLDYRLAAQAEQDARQQAAYDARQQAGQQAQMEQIQFRDDLGAIRDYEQNAPPAGLAQRQRQINANNQAIVAPEQEERNQILQGFAAGNPQWRNIGLSRGVLAYSADQSAEMARLNTALDKARTQNNLTPPQRAAAIRSLTDKLQAIENNPQPVPPQQQPPTPAEKFQQSTFTTTSPTTGMETTYTYDRSGMPRPLELSEQEKSHLKVEESRRIEADKAALGAVTSGGGPRPASVREHIATNPEAYNKLYDSVQKALTKPGEEGMPPTPPTLDEIRSEMNRRIELQEEMQREFQSKLNTPPPGQNVFGGPQGGFTPSPWSGQQQAPPQAGAPQAQMNVPDSAQQSPAPTDWLAAEPELKPIADALRREQESGGKKTDGYLATFRRTSQTPMPLPPKGREATLEDGGVYLVQGRPHVFLSLGGKSKFVPLP